MLPLRARVDLGAMIMMGVLHIPQSSSITGTSPSDCLGSYQDTRCGGGGVSPLQRCSWFILQPQPTGQWLVQENQWQKMVWFLCFNGISTLACLFGFYGISTFVGYLMPNPFFIQINSSISKVHSLIDKNISVSSYSV